MSASSGLGQDEVVPRGSHRPRIDVLADDGNVVVARDRGPSRDRLIEHRAQGGTGRTWA